jgi:LemA protein
MTRLIPPLAMLLLLAACGYNAVVDKDEAVKAAWSEVENQYQRRADLIPNLVNTVKGSAKFEQDTLRQVVEARASATSMKIDASIIDDPERLKRFEAAQANLSGALSRLIATVENYPDLKASQAFRDLIAQLEGTENRISVARRRYIESVADYNAFVQKFPTNLGARIRGKGVRPTFAATTPGAERAPEVKF